MINELRNWIVEFLYRNHKPICILREVGSDVYKRVYDVNGTMHVIEYYGLDPKDDNGKYYIKPVFGDKFIIKKIEKLLKFDHGYRGGELIYKSANYNGGKLIGLRDNVNYKVQTVVRGGR